MLEFTHGKARHYEPAHCYARTEKGKEEEKDLRHDYARVYINKAGLQ